jgi:hypothetical protein
MWDFGLGGRAGGLGEAGNGLDITPVAWAAVGVGVGRSGDDGEEVELGAGISNGPIAWAAIGGGEGGSNEVGNEEMELGAGAGEEWSGVPHGSVGGRCG